MFSLRSFQMSLPLVLLANIQLRQSQGVTKDVLIMNKASSLQLQCNWRRDLSGALTTTAHFQPYSSIHRTHPSSLFLPPLFQLLDTSSRVTNVKGPPIQNTILKSLYIKLIARKGFGMPSSSTQFGTYQTTRAPFFTKRTPAIRNGCLFSSEVCWDSVDSCNEYCAAITRSETSDETSLSTMIDVGNGTSFERSRIIRLWDAYAQYIQKTNTGFRQFSWCCWSIMLIKDTKLLVNLGDLEPPKNFLVGEINEEIRAVSVSETGKKSCMRDMNPKGPSFSMDRLLGNKPKTEIDDAAMKSLGIKSPYVDRKHYDAQKRIIDNLKTKVARLEETNQGLHKDCEANEDYGDAKNRECTEKDAKINELQIDINRLLVDNKGKDEAINQLQIENTEKDHEIMELKEELEQSKRAEKHSREQAQHETAIKSQMQEELTGFQNVNKEKDNELKSLWDLVSRINQKQLEAEETLKNERRDFEEERERLIDEHQRLNCENQRLELAIDEASETQPCRARDALPTPKVAYVYFGAVERFELQSQIEELEILNAINQEELKKHRKSKLKLQKRTRQQARAQGRVSREKDSVGDKRVEKLQVSVEINTQTNTESGAALTVEGAEIFKKVEDLQESVETSAQINTENEIALVIEGAEIFKKVEKLQEPVETNTQINTENEATLTAEGVEILKKVEKLQESVETSTQIDTENEVAPTAEGVEMLKKVEEMASRTCDVQQTLKTKVGSIEKVVKDMSLRDIATTGMLSTASPGAQKQKRFREKHRLYCKLTNIGLGQSKLPRNKSRSRSTSPIPADMKKQSRAQPKKNGKKGFRKPYNQLRTFKCRDRSDVVDNYAIAMDIDMDFY